MDFLEESHTIADVARHLFGDVRGYDVLLAIEEAGAHVEYLYQRGLLIIENLSELEHNNDHIAIYYRNVNDGTGRVS
jgi:hypothetical protein